MKFSTHFLLIVGFVLVSVAIAAEDKVEVEKPEKVIEEKISGNLTENGSGNEPIGEFEAVVDVEIDSGNFTSGNSTESGAASFAQKIKEKSTEVIGNILKSVKDKLQVLKDKYNSMMSSLSNWWNEE